MTNTNNDYLLGLLNGVGQNIPFNINLEAVMGFKATRIYQSLLSKSVYYEKNMPERVKNGWFYCTISDLEASTGIKEKSQRNHINMLVNSGLIEYKVCGLPARRHFRLIGERAGEKLREIVEKGLQAIGILKKRITTAETAIDLQIEIEKDELTPEASANSDILPYRFDKRSLPNYFDRICPLTDSADDRFARSCLDSIQRTLMRHKIGKTPINTDRLIDMLNDIQNSVGLKYYFDDIFFNNWQKIMRNQQFTSARAYFDTCLYNDIMTFNITSASKLTKAVNTTNYVDPYDPKMLEKRNLTAFLDLKED